MENFVDSAWEYLYAFIVKSAAILDVMLSHLHFLGPIPVIFLLAVVTLMVTKVLKKYLRTKRLVVLEKKFQYWLSIREEAMCCEDTEKGKALAKNIDSAELNKAYYDYFFEGLLLGFITFYLPVISMASYINESYRAERLLELFGRDYVLRFGDKDPVIIGALFLFICAIVLMNSALIIFKWIRKHYWVSESGRRQPKHSAGNYLEQSGVEGKCA